MGNTRIHPCAHVACFTGLRRHGGVKRSEQIAEILGCAVSQYSVSGKRGLAALRHVRFWGSFGARTALALKEEQLPYVALQRALVETSVDAQFGRGLVTCCYAEYGATASRFVPRALAKLGLPYILLPHNVESAVFGQFTGFGGEVERRREIAALRGADALWVISEFDRELVARCGAEARVLPYFPPERDLRWLESIRKGRKHSSKDILLVIGTVDNPPTRHGLQDLLWSLSRYDGDIPNASVILVGFGVERLNVPSSKRIQVFGNVSDEILAGLMMRAKCVLLRQPRTSGFATRLIELNLADIPVLINHDYLQGRGLDEYGISCYRSEDDFIGLIVGELGIVGRYFERPVDQENALRLRCVQLGATQ